MDALCCGYHIIEVETRMLPLCRVCGEQVEETTHRGNICRDCFNMEKREYYWLHKEQCKQYVDPEKQGVATRKWQKANPEKVRVAAKEWRQANPEKFRHALRLRDYRKCSAEGSFTQEEWQEKLEEYGNRCAYCEEDLGDSVTVDHDIPLSMGGSNYIDNLVPACKKCNSAKHTKTGDEFKALIMEVL